MVMLVVVMLVVVVTMVECSVCFAPPMLPELLRQVRHRMFWRNVIGPQIKNLQTKTYA
jgi:hypothetical protein